MIDRVLILLERFVTAYERYVISQERIAAASDRWITLEESRAKISVSDPVSPAEKQAILAPPTPAPVETQPSMTRAEVLDELRKLKIKYKATARTESLIKLLEAAKKEPVQTSFDGVFPREDPPAPSIPASFEGTTTAAAPESTDPAPAASSVSISDLRLALVDLAAAKGREVAFGILKKYGKKEKLSDVDTALYPEILKACLQEKSQ